MTRTPLLLALILTVAAIGCHPVAAQSPDDRRAATEAAATAASNWLDRLDAGDAEASWEAAHDLFQSDRSRDDWEADVSRLQDSLQTRSTRHLTMRQYRPSFSHLPDDGPFVLLKYHLDAAETRFEELVLTVQTDESWTVAAYEIRPLPSDSAAQRPPPFAGPRP